MSGLRRSALRLAHWTSREPWLSTKAVAVLCGVTGQTVRAWAKAGRLNPKKTPGGHYRFNPAEVDALLNESTVAALEAEVAV
jgi:excisionase family DNA binding protein